MLKENESDKLNLRIVNENVNRFFKILLKNKIFYFNNSLMGVACKIPYFFNWDVFI